MRSGVASSRSTSARVQPIGPLRPVNGASASAAMSARPRRPPAPVTATRIGRYASVEAARRSPYWRW